MQESTKKSFYYVLFGVSILLVAGLLFALVGYRNHGPLIERYNLGQEQKIGLVLLLVISTFLTYYSGSKYYSEK
jgi:uncharacterized membrane protein